MPIDRLACRSPTKDAPIECQEGGRKQAVGSGHDHLSWSPGVQEGRKQSSLQQSRVCIMRTDRQTDRQTGVVRVAQDVGRGQRGSVRAVSCVFFASE